MNDQNVLVATAISLYNENLYTNIVDAGHAMQLMDAVTPYAFKRQQVRHVDSQQHGIITNELSDGVTVCFEYGEYETFTYEEASQKLIFQ